MPKAMPSSSGLHLPRIRLRISSPVTGEKNREVSLVHILPVAFGDVTSLPPPRRNFCGGRFAADPLEIFLRFFRHTPVTRAQALQSTHRPGEASGNADEMNDQVADAPQLTFLQ